MTTTTPTYLAGNPAPVAGEIDAVDLPVTGTVAETPLAERPVEFPTLDDRLVGRASRYLYTVTDGAIASHRLAPDTAAGEAVFVPAQDGTREDDGRLISITTTLDGAASQMLVLDAGDVAGRPVAAVTLPRGVPAGFHGSWIGETCLQGRESRSHR